MLRNIAEGSLFIFSLLLCIALLGIDNDSTGTSKGVFSSIEHKADFYGRPLAENSAFITAPKWREENRARLQDMQWVEGNQHF